MRRAVEKAEEAYRTYGTTNPAIIARALGLRVLEEELKGRLREIYFGDSIVIRNDLSPAEKREMLAYALGHHLMHAGNHFAMQNRVYSFGNYHEKQADVFAACLLVPEARLEDQLRKKAKLWELAGHFEVTEKLIRLRVAIQTNCQHERDFAIFDKARARAGTSKPEAIDGAVTEAVKDIRSRT